VNISVSVSNRGKIIGTRRVLSEANEYDGVIVLGGEVMGGGGGGHKNRRFGKNHALGGKYHFGKTGG